jgi:CubicO group peptidase (beta-lactamase class C family)
MRRLFHTIFSFPLFCCTFIACNTDHPTVSASPRFADEPKKFGEVALTYSDTNSREWQPTKKSLDSFYNQQARLGFNGSVLIGYKGKILYERYVGFADREKQIPLSPAAPSQLASTSKTFTGAAVLYLHEHKYLNINDPVSNYLKSFPYPNITVKMLLCHRSGLPDYLHWVTKYNKDTRTPIYNNKVLALMAANKPPLDFKPDTRFKYSNSNYAMLALVIEEVTSMPYKTFMHKYVFQPLGMNHTYVYDPAEGMPANATVSYKANWAREPVMFADGVYGDKGIYSTVEDMYRWDQSLYANKMLSNETLELAYGPCSFEKPGVKNYGLGWRMLCYPDGYKIIYHNGWWHGNNTCFYRFIKDNFTIIVLGNKYTGSIYRQPMAVYKIVNGTTAGSGQGEDEGAD